MLQPLSYHWLLLARLKKPSWKDRCAPNDSGIKYGIRFSMNVNEAAQFDKENVNSLWDNEILKELEALMYMKVFKKLLLSLWKVSSKGYQFIPLRIVFDCRVDLRRKYRLVIGGHGINFSGHGVYASTTKSVSSRILKKITNNLNVMTGDISNTYINANTWENICTSAGTEFELIGIISEGTFWDVIKEMYGLSASGNRCHAHLLYTLRAMGVKPTHLIRKTGLEVVREATIISDPTPMMSLSYLLTPLLSLTSWRRLIKLRLSDRRKFILAVTTFRLVSALLLDMLWADLPILWNVLGRSKHL